jgi:Mn-dependent DtxR family transcriptional regulator
MEAKKMSVREDVEELLREEGCLEGTEAALTSTQMAAKLRHQVSTLSSIVRKMVLAGVLVTVEGRGLRCTARGYQIARGEKGEAG